MLELFNGFQINILNNISQCCAGAAKSRIILAQIFLKMVKVKQMQKNFIFLTVPIKA
jgi:hypothetical protein